MKKLQKFTKIYMSEEEASSVFLRNKLKEKEAKQLLESRISLNKLLATSNLPYQSYHTWQSKFYQIKFNSYIESNRVDDILAS